MAARVNQEQVWGRVLSPSLDDIKPEAARAILAMRLKKSDVERIYELSAFANQRPLDEVEGAELEALLDVGHLLTLMHSRARMALKRRPARGGRRKSA